ncbi:hypothetical protein FF011L_41430 [Roseimaritima multifibrata]|uniref:Sulfatase n=1 Tax=Roseimaritima multifibrata TaxID=1930274 RepID=A0A517MKD7_9BACT|nr:DUF1501 domain-containing protein [Roseimaritima multifibrata]QDS95349.1 hypothetical protein FF011L_41430 [Roseimaritima multifibrata]
MNENFTRRGMLQSMGLGFGGLAASQMLAGDSAANGILSQTHHPSKAKRVIFLFQSGGPSQLDLFDHKPLLKEKQGLELPDSVRGGQRLTGMSGNQSSLPLVGSPFEFRPAGECGTEFSSVIPHTASIADDICVVRSMVTEAINHGPGVTFMQSGAMIPGRPSMGAWLDYGLGTENQDLPAFVVMVTKDQGGQPLSSGLWGSGFLASKHQGVRFRSGADPVLYLNNPAGIDSESRRRAMDTLGELHQLQLNSQADGQIETRIAQYELAYRMQASIPEAIDLSDEPQHVLDQYGPDAANPGTFAANCLMARRLAERGVRFIQLYHPGWDHHGGLPGGLPKKCQQTDQPAAALVKDLKQAGLLDDTLVVWSGEFGRTNYCQGKLTANNFGRDHHPRCFSMWMAGGGVKPGMSYGQTDEYGYNVTENPVHVHDLQATILHLLGIDHERLTYKYQGRQFRLTDVHGHVVHDVLG